MNFINPIEILELQNYEISDIDSNLIKKAKRKVLAEIELSDDGYLNYKGHKIIRSDVERVVTELENKEKIEFYFFIANNPELNFFLVTGNESIFLSFKQESIYKLTNFINFISPFFAISYDKALYKSFKTNNEALLQKIISVNPLVQHSELDSCYRSISNSIRESIKEIDEITSDIRNEESIYDEYDIPDVFDLVQKKLNVKIINLLPQYFQSLRNKSANSIRNLSVNIFNVYDDSDLALDIISYSLEFKLDGLTEQNLKGDYDQIYKINRERVEQEKNAPVLKKYASLMIEIKSILEKLEKNELEIKNDNILVNDKRKNEFFGLNLKLEQNILSNHKDTKIELCKYISILLDIDSLNSLNEEFSEIKNQIALGLNALAISTWNNYNNIEASLFLVTKAFTIYGVSNETSKKLFESKNKINEIKNQLSNVPPVDNHKSTSNYQNQNVSKKNNITPIKSAPSLYTINGIGTKIYSDTLYFVLFFIPLLPLSRYLLDNQGTSYRFYGKIELNTWQKIWKYGLILLLFIFIFTGIINSINSKSNVPKENKKTENSKEKSNSESSKDTKLDNGSTKKSDVISNKYTGNQLKNGESPLDNCFGKGKFGGPSYITFRNNNESDAIVCLVNANTGKTIRNEYIRKGMDYRMKSVPSGTYYLKYVSGNDWNPNLKNYCGSNGNFQSNVHYSKSDNSSDYINVIVQGGKYSYHEITLYSVYNGNMSQESIDESEFFK